MDDTPIRKAIRSAGGLSALAARLNISKQAVNRWCHTKIPAERVLEVELATAHQVSRYELRPDIYGEPPD
jgi:DNA-binding transcriptional regulator YdaS (Cro superfamily)